MIYPVLVAEDDSKIAHVVRVCLENAGFRVVHAGAGREALALAEKAPPLLVILDPHAGDGDPGLGRRWSAGDGLRRGTRCPPPP